MREDLERPVLAVDVTLLRIERDELTVLLQRRAKDPFAGVMALPGVAVRSDETLLAAALRALGAKSGLSPGEIEDLHLEQLATFDALYRDPRGRTVSVAYLGLARQPGARLQQGCRWIRLSRLDQGRLPFDHAQILQTAVERLRGKLRYTNIAARLLPETFRIEELQAVYEALLGRNLNRANFRNKLLKIELIEQTGILPEAIGRQGGRPPYLYRFVQPHLEALDRDFL
jgi:8-oxo-dGTP diphosphatase